MLDEQHNREREKELGRGKYIDRRI